MKFKLDENLPLSSAAIVTSTGHDVHIFIEEGLVGTPDRDVISAAAAVERDGSTVPTGTHRLLI